MTPMTVERAELICGPDMTADLYRRAEEAGPLTNEQLRIVIRLFGRHVQHESRNTAA